MKTYQYFLFGLTYLFLATTCRPGSNYLTGPPPIIPSSLYTTVGARVFKSGVPIQLIGANTFHVFSAGGNDTKAWKLDLVREFIGNMQQTPLTGAAIKDKSGAYLASLQTLVDSNRAHRQITILCPFGWDGTPLTVFSGSNPTLTAWWGAYQTALKGWAVQFKDQPDVWLEVWNEPYRYDRTDGYTDGGWLKDMNAMVSIIRQAGNPNLILVPIAEQGQDESVLNHVGATFLSGKSNIVFDIHAYEKWLLPPLPSVIARLKSLELQNMPVLFGETAPVNAGTLMNPQPLLDSLYARGLSVTAWLWKYSDTDPDALLTAGGLPSTTQNNGWGVYFKNLAARARRP